MLWKRIGNGGSSLAFMQYNAQESSWELGPKERYASGIDDHPHKNDDTQYYDHSQYYDHTQPMDGKHHYDPGQESLQDAPDRSGEWVNQVSQERKSGTPTGKHKTL